jgi:hypothetical protein
MDNHKNRTLGPRRCVPTAVWDIRHLESSTPSRDRRLPHAGRLVHVTSAQTDMQDPQGAKL